MYFTIRLLFKHYDSSSGLVQGSDSDTLSCVITNMFLSSVKHGVGALFVLLSVTQLIAVLVRVRHRTSAFSDPAVGGYAAGILATGFFAVAILTRPLIPLEEERYINWYVVCCPICPICPHDVWSAYLSSLSVLRF